MIYNYWHDYNDILYKEISKIIEKVNRIERFKDIAKMPVWDGNGNEGESKMKRKTLRV